MPAQARRAALRIALLTLALAGLAALGLRLAPAPGPGPLEAARARMAAASSYQVHTTIDQRLTPEATPGQVGQGDSAARLTIDGEVKPAGESRYVLANPDAGADSTAALVVAGGRIFIERGGERAQVASPAGPAGALNPLDYLDAAGSVRPLGEAREGGQTFARFGFTLDGRRLARRLAQGDTQGAAALLAGATGEGEIWLGADGLPDRQVLTLQIPGVAGQRASVRAETRYAAIDAPAAPPAPPSWPAALAAALPAPDPAGALGAALLGGALLLGLAVRAALRRSWRATSGAITLAVVALIASGPALLPARAAQAAAPAVAPRLAAAPAAPPLAAPALSLPQAPSPAATCGDGAPGADTDGDGLTDQQEQCLGTDPYRTDTDADGLGDGLEVAGFSAAGKTWPTDPLTPDTNHDGRLDSEEWPAPAGAARAADLDGDGIPNIADGDDDGDGVPDAVDISPESRTAQLPAFTVSTSGDGYGGYEYVELQVRTADPARMRFSAAALDWPYDHDGQIQDLNGSREDLRLVPVLEITASQAPDATLASRYGVSVVRRDGQTILYAPLSPVGEGGRVDALSARLAFGPAPAALTLRARMVWLVDGALDRVEYGQTIYDSHTVVQSYDEPTFQVTGLQVTLSGGVESAILATPGRADDRYLLQLLYGWQAAVMGAQKLEGQSAARTALGEAVFRLTSANTPVDQRFGIPTAVAVAADLRSYGHVDESIADLNGSRIQSFLAAQGFPTTSQPALALAYQEETGGSGLDRPGLLDPGDCLTVALSSVSRRVVRGIRLARYAYDGGWRAVSPQDMAVGGGSADVAGPLADLQARYPALTARDLRALLTAVYLGWGMGSERVISVDGASTLPASQPSASVSGELSRSEAALPSYLVELLRLGAPGAGLRVGQSLSADYGYRRTESDSPVGITLPGVDAKTFTMTRNSMVIEGTEIPRLSLSLYLNEYKSLKAVDLLSHFVKDGKGYATWFKESKLTKGSKALKYIGAALSLGMTWAQFGLTTDWSNPRAVGKAVTLAIVSTAITLGLLLISLNPVGAVLTSVLAIIDMILYLVNGDTLTDRISRAVASFFYDYNVLTQLDAADFGDVRSGFARSADGPVAGNTFTIASDFRGVISRTSDGGFTDLRRSYAQGFFFSQTSPDVQNADANGQVSCSYNADATVRTCTNPVGVQFLLVAPQINAEITFTSRVDATTQVEDCSFTVCDTSAQHDSYPDDPSPTTMRLDVLPSTADGLFAWSALGNPDGDGDGLPTAQEQQAGTNPAAWDTDGDGLGDAFELQAGSDPRSADTDGDGLSDGLELQYGTSATSADTDGDGLGDGAEVRRYEGGQWVGGWDVGLPGGLTAPVFGSPTMADSDGDGLADSAERASGTSPFAANPGPSLTLRVTPVVPTPDGGAAVVGRPGDAVRLDVALLNGGTAPVASAMTLCLPALLTGVGGGLLYGARRPAAQTGACAGGASYAWTFGGADALQVGELVTTTLTAQISPALGASARGAVRLDLPYQTTDESGQVVTRSASQSTAVVVDFDSPSVTLGGAEGGQLLRGASLVLGGAASDPTSWVTGVELSADGGATFAPASLADGEWAFSWSLPSDGTYTLLARATDRVGRTGLSAPVSVKVDNTAPAVSPGFADGARVRPTPDGKSVVLSGSASDNLSGLQAVQISVDGKPWRDVALASPGSPASAWSYSWALPGGADAQGGHTIALRGLDRAGNVSADGAAVRTLVVDVVPPTDDLTTSDYLAARPPAVKAGAPTTLAGRSDDTGNAPRPAHPAPLEGTVDALQGATVWLMPDSAADVGPGTRVAWLGDVNGDGRGDLAVGLPDAAGGAGRVAVVYGRGGGWPATPDVESLAAGGTRFTGVGAAGLGGMVAPAGDTNADGYGDLLVGDPAGGRTYLVLGRAGTLGGDVALDGSSASGRVVLATPGLQLAAPAGDLNGDGADDLLLGSGGQLFVLLGRRDTWPGAVSPAREAAALLTLPAGGVATGVGDVDGDGRDDIAVGDPLTGKLNVYLGRADLTPGARLGLTAGPTYASFGGQAQIAALGRVSGSAKADFAYTTAGAPMLVVDGGGAAALSYTGASGGFIAAPGDVDADGAADILLGVPGDQSALLVSGADRSVLATLTGALGAASAPYAAGADLNCDSSSDLLLIPAAAPADAPPESERVTDPASFIAPGRLPGASVTTLQPAPSLPAGTRVVDDDYCLTCANDGLAWGTSAFSSIQTALDTAGALSVVSVRPGVYAAFRVTAARSGVAVVGASADAVIVDGAGGAYAAQVSGATGVRIAGMTLRNAASAVDLASAGVGGVTGAALRTTLDRLVLSRFSSHAVSMTRDSTADLLRSTVAGAQGSGSYLSVDPTPDAASLPHWSAASIANVTGGMGSGAQLFSEGGKIFALSGAPSNALREYRPPLNAWGVRTSSSGWTRGGRGAGGGDGTVYAYYPADLTPGRTRAIAVDGQYVYVGGEFSAVDSNGAALAANNIARWDTVSKTWSAMGAGLGASGEYVSAIAVVGGDVYAATAQVTTQAQPCCGVYRWRGGVWETLVSSVSADPTATYQGTGINAIAVDGGGLVYVAGSFGSLSTPAGTVTTPSSIARFNPATGAWQAFAQNPAAGPITQIFSLAVFGTNVYAGTFVPGSGVWKVPPAASGQPTTITTLAGAGTTNVVISMAVFGDRIIMGGSFDTAGGTTVNNLFAYFPGTSTIAPVANLAGGSGTTGEVDAVTVASVSGSAPYTGEILVAGMFTAPYQTAARISVAAGGNTWSAVGSANALTVNSQRRAIAKLPDGTFLVGGNFQGATTSAGASLPVYDLVVGTGGDWRALGGGASYGTSGGQRQAYRYDATAGSFLATPPLPWATLETSSAMAGDGAGGLFLLDGGSTLTRYTAASGWQRVAPLPVTAGVGTSLAFASGRLYATVGGGLRLYRYDPAGDSWAQMASAPAAMLSFAAGGGLAWDGRDYLYATNGGNGNQYARYRIAADTWESLGATGFQVGDGGSLARLGTSMFTSLGAASATVGDLRQLSPVGLVATKLTVSGSAFVAPAAVPAPDWIDLDASTEDFVYATSGSQWTQAAGQTWASPGAPATVGLSAAKIISQTADVYRVGAGSALTAGYASPRPDAHVSPLYCPSCDNDGYAWGETAFSSIQAAIDSGAPRVLLGPGLYRESISLVSGVQVIGAGADLSVIAPPRDSVRAVVTAEGVRGATLARVTVAGSGVGSGKPAGVVVEQGAQAVRIARAIIRGAPVGVLVSDAGTKVEIVNDTVVGNDRGVVVGVGVGEAKVRNTLFAANVTMALDSPGGEALHTYNGYYQNGADYRSGQTDLGSVASDPLFVDSAGSDYRLRDGSPMLGAGSPGDPTPPGTGGRVDIGYIQRGQAAFYADASYGPNAFDDGLDWGVDAFGTVQEALDAAARSLRAVGCRSAADGTCAYQITVGVGPGTYAEQLTLPSQVRLVGSGAGKTTIDGGAGSAITIDGVVNTAVSGLTLTGTAAGAGVTVRGAANTASLSRLVIRGVGTGVALVGPASATVSFSTIVDTAAGVRASGAGAWARVEHTILSNATVGLAGSSGGTVESRFNLLYGAPAGAAVVDGGGTLVGLDPQFVDAAAHDYRLRPGSPAVDAAAPWASPPAGGGSRADLGYAELLARPLVLLFGREDVSCAAGNSGVQLTEVGIAPVLDLTLPVTATLPTTWAPASLTQPGGSFSYWTASVTPAQEGYYRIYTRAADVAGNQEGAGPALYSGALYADGTAPTVTMGAPAVGAAAVELSASTDDADAADLAFEVDDGTTVYRVTAGWSGDASGGVRPFRAVAALPAGSYTVAAIARDRAGNEGRSAPRTFAVAAPAAHTVAFLAPQGGGFTSDSTLTLHGLVRFTSVSGAGAVAVSVGGGAPVSATLDDPYALSTGWSATVDLGAPGPKTIAAVASNGAGAGPAASVTITLDQTPPSLTLPGATPLVTRTVSLAGTAADAESGLAGVDVSFDGGYVWLPASLTGGAWGITWAAPASPQNTAYPVRVRARDLAGNERVSPMTVTVDTSAPRLGDLTFSIEPGAHLDAPPSSLLTASWSPATDDGGAVTLYASFDQSPSTVPAAAAGGASLAKTLDSSAAGVWYFHIRAVDAAGNSTVQHAGPWFVRDVGACGPLPIDVDGEIDLASGEWHAGRALLDDDERPRVQQSLFAALDVDSLFLGWRGARWAVDGTLFVYMSTGAPGSLTPAVTAPGVSALPRPADLAVAITSPTSATLWRYTGGAWQPRPFTASDLTFAQGPSGDTELRLSRALAGSMANLVVFAADEGGAPWSVFPTTNPLAGSWADAYTLPADCVTPVSAGQPSYVGLSLATSAGQDPALPLGPGASVAHTVAVTNRETRPVSGAQLRLAATAGLTYQSIAGASCAGCAAGLGAWAIPLPTIAAGGTAVLTVTGRLDASLGALRLVTSTVELDVGGLLHSRAEEPQRVDGLPPAVALTTAPGGALLPGGQTLVGSADDGDGVGVQGVELRPQGGSWQPASGTISWSAGLSVPTQQSWSVELRATDRSGLVGASQAYTFTVDQDPPTAGLALPPLLAGSTAVITGTASDPAPAGAEVAGVEVQVGDASAPWLPAQVFAPAGGAQGWAYTWALPDADREPYQLRARAVDAAGNVGAPTAWGATLVDSRAPAIVATLARTAVDLAVYPEDAIFGGTAADASGVATLRMRVFSPTGDSYLEPVALAGGVWSYTPQRPLTAGAYRFVLEAADGAGNRRQSEYAVVVTGQAPPPLTVAVTRLDPAVTNAASVRFQVTFNMTVTGLVTANLGLTTTGLTGASITGVAGSGATYTVTVGTGSGDGTLALDVVDSTGVRNIVDKPVSNLPYAGPAYTINRTNPIATFDPVAPALRSTAVASATLRFSAPVTGVDIGDLALTRGGAPVPLTGAAIASADGAIYTVTGLAPLTAADGAYVLTLAAAGSGIADAAGNPPAADASVSFTVETVAPTVTIAAVAPDPRNTAVASMAIVFSEPVAGLDLGDLALTRGGGPNLLTGAETLASADGVTWTLGGLAPLTAADGGYALTLAAAGSGIADLAGNPLAAGASRTFTVDTTAPAVLAIDRLDPPLTIAPSVRFQLTFSEPVATLTAANLALVTAGVSGASVTGVAGGGTTWVVAVATGSGDGTVALRLAGSAGLSDAAGNPAVDFSLTSAPYTIDRSALLAQVGPVTPDPRSAPLASVPIVFGKPVTGLDVGDLTLTRDGGPNLLTGAETLTSADGAAWTLGGLAPLTAAEGVYTLTLRASGSGIVDGAGNPLAGDSAATFRIDRTAPTATVDPVSPDPRTVGVREMTLRFSEPVAGLDLADLTLTRAGAPVDLAGAALDGDASGQVWTLSGLARATFVPGTYALTLRAAGSGVADLAGNPLAGDASGGFSYDHAAAFLPTVVGRPKGPDLAATVRLSPDRRTFRADEPVVVTVEVTNRGDRAAGGFWVDLMVNPSPVPTGATIWTETCTLTPCQGVSWYVPGGLRPGETVVLTTRPDSYAPDYTRWSEYLDRFTRNIYVVVDSWNGGDRRGAVLESDEANNIVAIDGIQVTAGPARAAAPRQDDPRPMPPRP